MQGRIVAAGVSVAVGGALVGFMAAGDHTADASPTATSSSSSSSSSSATPYQPSDDGREFPSANGGAAGDAGFPQAQPQTRTGGS